MRRGSLTFPLLLIALGVLFLVSNLYPNLRPLELLSRYGPLLLIGWGLLRSIELIMLYQMGRALPAAGLSGGEWLVAFFLILIVGGLAVYQRSPLRFPADRITVRSLEVFGESYERSLSARVAAPSIPRVVVENLRGRVRIRAAGGHEVTVSGRNLLQAFSEAEADRIHQDLGLTAENQNGVVMIRTNQERGPAEVRVSSELDIVVPQAAVIECKGRYGDFEVTGVQGNVQVSSDHASVRLQDLGGSVRLDLRRSDSIRAVNIKGEIEIRGRGNDLEIENVEGPVTIQASYSGELTFRKLSKPLRYESASSRISVERIPGFLRLSRGEIRASQLAGPIRVESKTKDIRLSEFSGPLAIEVDRGDIGLRPGKGFARIDVRTASGEIDLALPEGAKFAIEARASRGEVSNDWGPPFQEQSEGRGASLSGKNGAGPEIVARTNRGSITLRKAGAPEPFADMDEARRPDRFPHGAEPDPPPPRAPRPPSPPLRQ